MHYRNAELNCIVAIAVTLIVLHDKSQLNRGNALHPLQCFGVSPFASACVSAATTSVWRQSGKQYRRHTRRSRRNLQWSCTGHQFDARF